ncbi:DUF4262 domain-containing protein [Qipengyuania gelatinilytica]|uniref:DUF4262 domain-containing protein n=1 Tax=Qipengyuania gelatinilytica TaxID=2867231 RepID=A0ABX9A5E7_9SPHN|nr:DUF4262 domain-containing protein [Qipengyuania gelatinilytica]QZD95539.1 DUF4262 domain-containing protein [Qipengyuania gelatinilytica]
MFQRLKDWYFESQLAAHRDKTARAIAKHGWTATYVGDERSDQAEFAYTIGFSDFGAPELIVFDLDPVLMNYVFWEAFERVKSGSELFDGFVFREPDPEANGFECTFRTARHSEVWDRYVFDAIAYSRFRGRGDRPDVMQIVWPSSRTLLYPWDLDCPPEVTRAQPKLY